MSADLIPVVRYLAEGLLGRYTLGQVTDMLNSTLRLSLSPEDVRRIAGLPSVRRVA